MHRPSLTLMLAYRRRQPRSWQPSPSRARVSKRAGSGSSQAGVANAWSGYVCGVESGSGSGSAVCGAVRVQSADSHAPQWTRANFAATGRLGRHEQIKSVLQLGGIGIGVLTPAAVFGSRMALRLWNRYAESNVAE